MKSRHTIQGYTLTELMITVGIIGVIAAIAVPTYKSYVNTSKLGTVIHNAKVLAGFEDAYFYENETYLAGIYEPAGANTLSAKLDWYPSGDDNTKYVVVAGSDCAGDITKCYSITVSLINDPTIVHTLARP